MAAIVRTFSRILIRILRFPPINRKTILKTVLAYRIIMKFVHALEKQALKRKSKIKEQKLPRLALALRQTS